MSVVYEVNLDIDPDTAEAFLGWLETGPDGGKGHVAEMLEIDGFESAQLFDRRADDEGGDAAGVLVTVQYVVRDREALETYFKVHAPRMRGDGIKRFEGKFRASRRILHRRRQ